MNEIPLRILIADDHPIVRDGLVAVLSTQPDFVVVGVAGDGNEALKQIAALQPDVVLLDLEMPVLDGVSMLRALQTMPVAPSTLVFTAFDTDDRIIDAVRAGAKGYLLKGAPRAELFQAVRIIGAGGSLLQPVIASRLIERLNQPTGVGNLAGATPVDALTPRENEVLQLMARGKSNREIADQLVIAERTVKFHISSILAKFGARNRTQAVAIANERNMIE